jgi:hypothetical protein
MDKPGLQHPYISNGWSSEVRGSNQGEPWDPVPWTGPTQTDTPPRGVGCSDDPTVELETQPLIGIFSPIDAFVFSRGHSFFIFAMDFKATPKGD